MVQIKTKKQAFDIFGGKQGLMDALGCTRQAIDQIPKYLPKRRQDQLLGAAIRLGKISIQSVAT
jgi:hypothetical protein